MQRRPNTWNGAYIFGIAGTDSEREREAERGREAGEDNAKLGLRDVCLTAPKGMFHMRCDALRCSLSEGSLSQKINDVDDDVERR